MHTLLICAWIRIYIPTIGKKKNWVELHWMAIFYRFTPISTFKLCQREKNGLPTGEWAMKETNYTHHIGVPLFSFEGKRDGEREQARETEWGNECEKEIGLKALMRFVVLYHWHFSGFSVRSSRPNRIGFNRARNTQFPIFILFHFLGWFLRKVFNFPYKKKWRQLCILKMPNQQNRIDTLEAVKQIWNTQLWNIIHCTSLKRKLECRRRWPMIVKRMRVCCL